MPQRAILGYRRSEVDALVSSLVAELGAARDEVAQLRADEPLGRVGAEVADMLRALTASVSAVQDQAEHEASQIIEAARAEAAQIREEAECFAEALVDRLLGGAIDRLGGVVGARERLRSALVEARRSADTALAALEAAGTIDLDALAAESNGHHENGSTPNGSAPLSEDARSALVGG